MSDPGSCRGSPGSRSVGTEACPPKTRKWGLKETPWGHAQQLKAKTTSMTAHGGAVGHCWAIERDRAPTRATTWRSPGTGGRGGTPPAEAPHCGAALVGTTVQNGRVHRADRGVAVVGGGREGRGTAAAAARRKRDGDTGGTAAQCPGAKGHGGAPWRKDDFTLWKFHLNKITSKVFAKTGVPLMKPKHTLWPLT